MKDLHSVDWASLPQPEDDGAAKHLPGTRLQSVQLPSTRGGTVDLSLCAGRTVVYAYPKTGQPGTALPEGWDAIPGARGCTPQSCAFRDHANELAELGVQQLFGLSTQSTSYQQEAATRLHLPFALLSDAQLSLQRQLDLPTMEVEGDVLLKRITLIIDDGVISRIFYPVFPPDESAEAVMRWLKQSN